MPWIDEYESGDVGHGTAGERLCLNNQAVGSGGTGGWIDGRRLIFGNGADGWIASSYDRETGEKARLKFPSAPNGPLDVVVSGNTLAAGGGHYAAWSGAQDASRGLYSSTGLRLPDGGLLAMGPDGACAYKPRYQSDGPSLVREADGPEWQLTPGSPSYLQLLGLRRAVWTEGTTAVRAIGVPQPVVYLSGGVWRTEAAFVAGRWWIAYFNGEKGVVLHPFDSAERAYAIAPTGDAWHTIRAVGPYVVRVAVSRTEGEGPGDVWGYDIDVRSGAATPLPFGAQPQEPTTLPFLKMSDINPKPIPPIALPAPTRDGHFGFFEFKQEQGRGPGNSQLLVRNWSGHVDRSIVVTDESAGKVFGTILGRFIAGATVDEIEARAAALAERPIAYWDDNRWPRWPSLPTGAWCCVRMYMPKEQTVERFEAECRATLSSAPKGLPLVMVPQQYTSNASLAGYIPPTAPAPQDSSFLKQLAPIFARMFNDFPNVVAMYPFSGYGRLGGLDTHPDMVKPWDDWAAQLVAPAIDAYPPTPDPQPPKPQPSPFFVHKGVSMTQEIDGKIVVLRGPKGMLMRPDVPGTGIWKDADPKGQWRGAKFDVANASDPRAHYRAKKLSSGRYTFFSLDQHCYAGEDGGQYTPDVLSQFYHLWTGAPDARVGDLEQWRVYDGNESGAIEAQIEQTTDDKHPAGAGHKFFAYPLSVEAVG